MPRYWILSMSEDNYMLTKEHSLIGMTKRGRRAIYQMDIGDMITFYISRKRIDATRNDFEQHVRKIRGLARVSGEVFESNERLWYVRGEELFSYRRPVEFLSDVTKEARPLLIQLSYVTNPSQWALPLRTGYIEITKTDFRKIQAALETERIPHTSA